MRMTWDHEFSEVHTRPVNDAIRTTNRWLFALCVALLGSLAVIVVGPVLPIVGLSGLAVLVAVALKGYKVFWAYLMFILLGYLFLGKGFAYIGLYPLYVSEVGLALAGVSGLAVFLVNRSREVSRFMNLQVLSLLAFVVWQALCTIPYLSTYGIDALRDASLWGYAAFAFFILLLVPRESIGAVFRIYGKVLPYFLVWLPVALLLTSVLRFAVYFPGAPVPLIALKAGDVGVHLAGAAAFMLLRLDSHADRWSDPKLWSLWGLWLVDWVVYGATNRGGMLSALLGIGVVSLLRPATKWYRPVVLGTALMGLLTVTGATISLSFTERDISAQQLVSNVQSIFTDEGPGQQEATESWRKDWWAMILGYTFGGEHFWVGKGYGVNLALDDGIAVPSPDEQPLRSPHNSSMTILARSGVPGLILWLAFLMSFGGMLVKKALTGGRTDPEGARYALWLLAYWLAFLLNSNFDVFLEGPMGGVWFWSLIGMTLAYFRGRKLMPRANGTRARQVRSV
jgi:hypothetical protein